MGEWIGMECDDADARGRGKNEHESHENECARAGAMFRNRRGVEAGLREGELDDKTRRAGGRR